MSEKFYIKNIVYFDMKAFSLFLFYDTVNGTSSE